MNITIHLILLSLWGADLLFLCVEGLGLDLHALQGCLVTVYDQLTAYSDGAAGDATSNCVSCIRTLSTDSLDSMGTMDTVTTSSEPPGALTSSPEFNFGSVPSTSVDTIVGSYTTTPVLSAATGALNPPPKFNFGSYGQRGTSGIDSSGFMVPPPGYFRFGSSSTSAICPDPKGSVVPDIPSLRRIVRVKGSSMPTTTSETHSLLITEEASIESSASTSTQESVQAGQSPLESSANVSAPTSLFQSGEVPIYGWWSHERSCLEHFSITLDELVQYNQACESLRYDLYRQSCAFDCYPPSFERYNERCETAYQRWMLSFDPSHLDDLLALEGARPVSAASKPPTASVQPSESQSDSSSSMSASSDCLSDPQLDFTDLQSASSDPLSESDDAEVTDVDYVHLQVSWRRYHARCRLADRLQSYAALSSGTFALHNLIARMHRGRRCTSTTRLPEVVSMTLFE